MLWLQINEEEEEEVSVQYFRNYFLLSAEGCSDQRATHRPLPFHNNDPQQRPPEFPQQQTEL
jgi:hypothetical protein